MKNSFFITTNSSSETVSFGKSFANNLNLGTVIWLKGELGMGKTTFVQGLTKGLGCKYLAKSPTFNIIKLYEGRLKLFHCDLYRLVNSVFFDFMELGLNDVLEQGALVIEWANFGENSIPNPNYIIEIEKAESENQRKFIIETL